MSNQTSTCPICLNQANLVKQYLQSKSIFSRESIFSCPKCFHSFNNNIKQEELNKYYAFDYNSNDFDRKGRFKNPSDYYRNEIHQFKVERSKLHLKISKKLLKNWKNLNIIDFGAGLGTTLFWAKYYFNNPNIFAYENDKFSHEYLDHIGAMYFSGDPIKSINSSKEKYDLIILSHFLEHISSMSIIEYIEALLRKLNHNGILLIEVPHDDWVNYEHLISPKPPHVHFFSKKSLKNLFNGRAKIKFFGTFGSSLIVRRGFLRKSIDKIAYIFNLIIHKVPKTLNGSSIIICVSNK